MDADYAEIAIIMGIVGAMLSMLGMGLLIAYYGSSKTRNVGFVFLVFGLILAYYLSTTQFATGIHWRNARWNTRDYSFPSGNNKVLVLEP